ncbi:pilus assembly protein TadG-related protein [Azospirillum ramasamyi]|uniref:Putative Flp pilus-assembly TadG-like N-terminal domain-containing protein n=1 Tax=Azospirillum ramasamyi TaxID=682998 RepID=A0A2U9S5Y6_9PROT|nr:pilus assembly protein TadG-related protein [Azospirillum ramasamyi]AWU94281.1 hypothetical protein DM194_08380 [Azospirillum ramasamyi]
MTLVYRPLPYGGHEDRRTGRHLLLVVGLILAIPTVLGAGCTLDALRSFAVEARLSHAVDAAALAGGRVMFDSQRDGHIRSFFDNAYPRGFLGADLSPLTIAEDAAAGTLTVSAHATVNAIFLRLFGKKEVTVQAQSVVHRGNHSRGRLQ